MRYHALKVSQLHPTSRTPSAHSGKYICSVGVCKKEFDVYKKFLGHLHFHLSLCATVKCPYFECPKVYKNRKSLCSHLSRYHRLSTIPKQCQGGTSAKDNSEDYFVEDFTDTTDCLLNEVSPCIETENDFILQNLAQFCMRLEYHHLISEKVIQFIVEEMSHVYSHGLASLNKEFRRQMELQGIPSEKIELIVSNVFKSDPLTKSLKNDLGSSYKRKEFYKKTFPFVEPEKIDYVFTKVTKTGEEVRTETFFYYISIKETLQACFLDKSLNLKLERVVARSDEIIEDYSDGKVFINNKFFQDNPICVRIAIYQDGVEIVNPLGSAKAKHKVLAIYLSILNLPDYVRCHINSIKLVALCKEKFFDHSVVYGKVVKDLKELETDGLNVEGIGNVKVGLVYIAGDNLGSHSLGGFVCNFSTSLYFCRFCDLFRKKFNSRYGESIKFDLRTVESYQDYVQRGKFKKYGYKGVKYDSEFNQLQSFHVCSPGLSSCIGHDAMEGIIAYDLKLFIDYFIEECWFTLHELNEAILNFTYSKEEKQDQPPPVQEGAERIKGGAWQVWTLLRLFPLIMQDYIQDDKHEVWKALMLLTEITEIVTAPSLHKSHLPYLQSIIDDYLTLRKSLFPNVPLRPKHHYWSHAAWLYIMFGPAIKAWTMRYESKHSFFKRIARVVRNFKNILFTFAMKHELLQCYLRSGADLRCEIQAIGTNKFLISNYSNIIQSAITSVVPSLVDIEECLKVTVKGTEYEKGDILVLGQDSYECNVRLGRISLILYDCDHSVYFVCEKLETSFRPYQRLYTIGKSEGFVCVRQDTLLCFYPSMARSAPFCQLVKLKHALVRNCF